MTRLSRVRPIRGGRVVRRRAKPAPTDGHLIYPPELLNRQHAKWRTWTPTEADVSEAQQHAAINPSITTAAALEMQAQCAAFRAWSDARRAWAVDNGLADGAGRVDWHRLAPIIARARDPRAERTTVTHHQIRER